MNRHMENDQEGLRLKQQLQRAVRSEQAPPFLEARIKSRIRSEERPRQWMRRLVPVAAAAAICLGVGIAYELGHLRFSRNSQESYIASVSNHVATIMRAGLQDHVHCSVFRKFPKNPPKVEELVEKIGPKDSGLVAIVQQQVPAEYKLMIAHQCGYHGRKYVHLSMKSDSKLMSLVIARKGEGESFTTENLIPALVQSGLPMYRTSVQRFQIASFETRENLVYLVSDLSEQQNMQMMLALAPRVRDFLER